MLTQLDNVFSISQPNILNIPFSNESTILAEGSPYFDHFIIKDSDVISPNFRLTIKLYFQNIVDKDGWLIESQIPNLPIPDLQKEEIERIIKQFADPFLISGKGYFQYQTSLLELLDKFEKESSVIFESKELIGSDIVWLESPGYHKRIFAQYGQKVQKLSPEKLRPDLVNPPDDIDSRFHASSATKEVRQKLRLVLIDQIAKRIVDGQNQPKSYLAKQYGFKKLCDVNDKELQGNHFLMAAFGSSKKRFELAIVKTVARPFLCTIDAQKLSINALLQAIKHNAAYPKMTPQSDLKNGVRQAIFDIYGMVVHFVDIKTLDIKACIRLCSYLTKGYCSPDPGSVTLVIERLLFLSHYSNKISALKEGEWANEIAELLRDCCKSHHKKDPQALIALLFNLSVLLQQSKVLSDHIALIWDRVLAFYIKQLDDLKKKNKIIESIGLFHSAVKAYNTSLMPFEAILALIQVKAFVYLNIQACDKELPSRKVFLFKNNGQPASQIVINKYRLVQPMHPHGSIESLLKHANAFRSEKEDIKEFLQEVSQSFSCAIPFKKGGSSPLWEYLEYLQIEKLQNLVIDKFDFKNPFLVQLGYDFLLACHALKPGTPLQSFLFTNFPKAMSKLGVTGQEYYLKSLEGIAQDVNPESILALAQEDTLDIELIDKRILLKWILLLVETNQTNFIQKGYQLCSDALIRWTAKEQKNLLFKLMQAFINCRMSLAMQFLISLQEKDLLTSIEERNVFGDVFQRICVNNAGLKLTLELPLLAKASKLFFAKLISLPINGKDKDLPKIRQMFVWLIPQLFRQDIIPIEDAYYLLLEATRHEFIQKNTPNAKTIWLKACEDALNYPKGELSYAIEIWNKLQNEFGILKVLPQATWLLLKLAERLYELHDIQRGDYFISLLTQSNNVEEPLKSQISVLQEQRIQRLINAMELNQALQDLSLKTISLDTAQKINFRTQILKSNIAQSNLQGSIEVLKQILKENIPHIQMSELKVLSSALLMKLCDPSTSQMVIDWNLNQAHQLLTNSNFQKLYSFNDKEKQELLFALLESICNSKPVAHISLIFDLLEMVLQALDSNQFSRADLQAALLAIKALKELWQPKNVLSKGLIKQIKNNADRLFKVLFQEHRHQEVCDFFLALDFHQLQISFQEQTLKSILNSFSIELNVCKEDSQRIYTIEQLFIKIFKSKSILSINLQNEYMEISCFFIEYFFALKTTQKAYGCIESLFKSNIVNKENLEKKLEKICLEWIQRLSKEKEYDFTKALLMLIESKGSFCSNQIANAWFDLMDSLLNDNPSMSGNLLIEKKAYLLNHQSLANLQEKAIVMVERLIKEDSDPCGLDCALNLLETYRLPQANLWTSVFNKILNFSNIALKERLWKILLETVEPSQLLQDQELACCCLNALKALVSIKSNTLLTILQDSELAKVLSIMRSSSSKEDTIDACYYLLKGSLELVQKQDVPNVIIQSILQLRHTINPILQEPIAAPKRKVLESLLIQTLIKWKDVYFYVEAYSILKKNVDSKDLDDFNFVELLIEMIEKSGKLEKATPSNHHVLLLLDLLEAISKMVSDQDRFIIWKALAQHPASEIAFFVARQIIEKLNSFPNLPDQQKGALEQISSTIKPLLAKLVNYNLVEGFIIAKSLLAFPLISQSLKASEQNTIWGHILKDLLKTALSTGNAQEIVASLFHWRTHFNKLEDNFIKCCIDLALDNILHLLTKYKDMDLFTQEYELFVDCLLNNVYDSAAENSSLTVTLQVAQRASGRAFLAFSKPIINSKSSGQKKYFDRITNALHQIIKHICIQTASHQSILLVILHKDILLLIQYFPHNAKELIALMHSFIFEIEPSTNELLDLHTILAKNIYSSAISYNIIDQEQPSFDCLKFMLYLQILPEKINMKKQEQREILELVLNSLFCRKNIVSLQHAIAILAHSQLVILNKHSDLTEKFFKAIIKIFKSEFIAVDENYVIYYALKKAIIKNPLFTSAYRSKDWQSVGANLCTALFNILLDQTQSPSLHCDLIEELCTLLEETWTNNCFEGKSKYFFNLVEKLQPLLMQKITMSKDPHSPYYLRLFKIFGCKTNTLIESTPEAAIEIHPVNVPSLDTHGEYFRAKAISQWIKILANSGTENDLIFAVAILGLAEQRGIYKHFNKMVEEIREILSSKVKF